MGILEKYFSQNSLIIIFYLCIILIFLLLIAVICWLKYKKRHIDQVFFNPIISLLMRYWVAYIVVLFSLLLFSALAASTIAPKIISPSGPALESTVISAENPLIIEFSRFVSNKITHEISPPLEGNWQIKNDLLRGRSRLIFVPDVTPDLATRYTINLSKIKNILSNKQKNYLLSVETPKIPEIISVSPENNSENVLPEQKFVIKTTLIVDNTAEFSFEFSPNIEFDCKNDGDEYQITAKNGFSKNTEYNLKIYRSLQKFSYVTGSVIEKQEKIELESIHFRTVALPGVKSTSPSGFGVMVDSNIEIIFNQPVQKESVESNFSITPSIEGEYSWKSDTEFVFDPASNLTKNTLYTVKILKNVIAYDGSAIESEIIFSFTTIGFVEVSSFSPVNGAKGVSGNAPIIVTFNQSVDHAEAESKFSIEPLVSGSFGWDGNRLIFSHQNLAEYQSYTVKIDSGVKTIYGLDSNKSFTTTFTTKISNKELNVPAYHQAHMYTCMSSAARSALAFRGVYLSEDAISNRIGFDSTTWSGTWSEDGAVWGDPSAGIVGDIDGKANNIGWGYGSHWSPVAEAINSFGRSAEIKTGWTVEGLASEIESGNPVIIWWVNGVWPAYEVNWKTPGGKSVRGVNSMHVQVVKGFSGSAGNPQSFTVTDSGYGYPGRSYDLATFKAKWSWFGNTAVVVR